MDKISDLKNAIIVYFSGKLVNFGGKIAHRGEYLNLQRGVRNATSDDTNLATTDSSLGVRGLDGGLSRRKVIFGSTTSLCTRPTCIALQR